ncbi:MAG: hypothetical protein M1834_002223 [Cirrosporium novae-zelandiae]|nr:MAG: hypothetical protein M1834_002223 [Cirrosporium novae-zelandiae]
MATTSLPPGSEYPKHVEHRYGTDHELQKLSLWFIHPPSSDKPTSKFWIMYSQIAFSSLPIFTLADIFEQSYIHGGAWRDPLITSTSFAPTLNHLLTSHSGDVLTDIAAVASLDYRLSEHPDFPQHGHSTTSFNLRNARHPDHVHDVHAAIAFLQDTYEFQNNYILVGHSCGATLAFQIAMGDLILQEKEPDKSEERELCLPTRSMIAMPKAIVGISGIYDIRVLRDNYADASVYHEFIVGAFGVDEEDWDHVSPARHTSFDKTWPSGELVIIAHSVSDGLIEPAQIKMMRTRLENLPPKQPTLEVISVTDLEGAHDELWENGKQIASTIALAVKKLKK